MTTLEIQAALEPETRRANWMRVKEYPEPTEMRIMANPENEAKVFWEALRMDYPSLKGKEYLYLPLYHLCDTLARDGKAILPMDGSELFRRAENYLCSLPGYRDGPKFAREALMWYADS